MGKRFAAWLVNGLRPLVKGPGSECRKRWATMPPGAEGGRPRTGWE